VTSLDGEVANAVGKYEQFGNGGSALVSCESAFGASLASICLREFFDACNGFDCGGYFGVGVMGLFAVLTDDSDEPLGEYSFDR